MRCTATKVDNPIHEKVTEKCNDQGCTVSEYLRNLILKDLNGKNDAPDGVIERADGTFILPAGSIMHSDGGVSCPDGSMLITFDDEEIRSLEEVSRIMRKDDEL